MQLAHLSGRQKLGLVYEHTGKAVFIRQEREEIGALVKHISLALQPQVADAMQPADRCGRQYPR